MTTLTIVSAADTARSACYPRAAFRDADEAAEYEAEIEADVAYTATHEVPAPDVDENGSHDDEGDGYPCPECSRSFDTPQGLAGHTRSHSDDGSE